MVSVTNMIPTLKGYKGAPTSSATSVSALAAACQGSVTIVKLDGTSIRTFAGTSSHLYEISGTSWVDRSRGGNYSIGAGKWRYCQFGDATIAANKANLLQATTSGSFADVASSPQANCMDVAQGFVMLGDTTEATYGDSPDRWWCSAIYDYTTWTPSVATQATTGRLVDVPGKITAMKALGANFIAYKDRAMFIGQYIGPPLVWQWTMIPGEIGCASQEAVVSIGTEHIFIGASDIYRFDGSRPVSIGDGIREWFFGNMNTTWRSNIQGLHDRKNATVYFFYPTQSSASGQCDACLVYHYKTNKWGHMTIGIESVSDFQTASVSYDSSPGIFDVQTQAFDSPVFSGGIYIPSLFNTSHVLSSLTGITSNSSFTTWDIGNDWQFRTLRRARPRYIYRPTTGNMTNAYRNTPAESMTSDQTVGSNNDAFDTMREARWHRLTFAHTGNVELSGISLDFMLGGTE